MSLSITVTITPSVTRAAILVNWIILSAELNAGKLSLAFTEPSQVHALGVIPKSNKSVRNITDCSRPKLKTLNNYMKDTFSSFNFNTLDDIIVDISPGSFMATIDLQDAYLSVPIHPEDRKHFGLQLNFGDGPVYLTDNFLCFGANALPLFLIGSLTLFHVYIDRGHL